MAGTGDFSSQCPDWLGGDSPASFSVGCCFFLGGGGRGSSLGSVTVLSHDSTSVTNHHTRFILMMFRTNFEQVWFTAVVTIYIIQYNTIKYNIHTFIHLRTESCRRIAAEHLANVQQLVVSLQMNGCIAVNMQQAKLSFYECVLPCSIYPVL
jgi:hypothetical protein